MIKWNYENISVLTEINCLSREWAYQNPVLLVKALLLVFFLSFVKFSSFNFLRILVRKRTIY